MRVVMYMETKWIAGFIAVKRNFAWVFRAKKGM